MALINPNINHCMIDGALFQDEVSERKIMSVPTIFLNGEEFGQGRVELEEIINQIPEDWIFVQLGDFKKSTSLKYSNNDRVAFLPRCLHIEALHAHQDADCLLYLNFPESRMYNFTSPLKLFEYIISGKPFISTIGGATDEILQTLQEYGVYKEMESYLELVSTGKQNDIFLKQAELLEKKVSWDERARHIINSYIHYLNK